MFAIRLHTMYTPFHNHPKGISLTMDDLYLPFRCQITGVRDLTPHDRLFTLVRCDGKPLGHRPGQFVQLSIPGFEEAPLSVASAPGDAPLFELGVRRVGRLTAKLHSLSVGDRVGIRGPFGQGFPLEELEGNDLLLIAGGCGLAPLRSLIRLILDRPDRFGRATLLYGAKNQREILFRDEFADWERGGFSCSRTVDHQPEGGCRDLRVGFVTELIREVPFDPARTDAVVVGPPVMYPPAVAVLKGRGIPSCRIHLSLERQMRCGVGKCGHCAIDHLFCCTDGPVFRLDRLEGLEGWR